jgi:hypothetical protein
MIKFRDGFRLDYQDYTDKEIEEVEALQNTTGKRARLVKDGTWKYCLDWTIKSTTAEMNIEDTLFMIIARAIKKINFTPVVIMNKTNKDRLEKELGFFDYIGINPVVCGCFIKINPVLTDNQIVLYNSKNPFKAKGIEL